MIGCFVVGQGIIVRFGLDYVHVKVFGLSFSLNESSFYPKKKSCFLFAFSEIVFY